MIHDDLAGLLEPKCGNPVEDLAFLRDERQYLNLLLTEIPKGDWAQTILRQFFFSAFHSYYYTVLKKSKDAQLAAIAEKSIKEVTYHLRWSSEWVIRLGDGTAESHRRMLQALQELWAYTGEMFAPSIFEKEAVDIQLAKDPSALKNSWMENVQKIFEEADLEVPKQSWMQAGGKEGRHTEHLGYLLAEMQHLQRTYPNVIW